MLKKKKKTSGSNNNNNLECKTDFGEKISKI